MPIGQAKFGLLGGVPDLGKLELIETQTISSSVTTVDFTSIQEDIYNVHLLTYNNIETDSASGTSLKAQFYESGVVETASVYQSAYKYGFANGTFGENRSLTYSELFLSWGFNNTSTIRPSGFHYFYNLGNSSKFSFQTGQWTQIENNGVYVMGFGLGLMEQASVVDGIRVKLSTAGNLTNGSLSLYGIAAGS